jgi:carbamoyl-phosphate synthase large subunit
VIHAEASAGPVVGVIAQLGGQTPLGLARGLQEAGIQILGTSPDAIDAAEDRGIFGELLRVNNLTAPTFGMANSFEEAVEIAHRIEYPVLVRPSFVLGGRGMEIVYDDNALAEFIKKATDITPNHPVLIDKFLDNAIEIDVDALFDGEELFLAGVMEHIEEAGIHSGDSACVIPSISIDSKMLEEIRIATLKLAKGTNVRGLINIQYAISNGKLYVIEANPRASRTVPFVSKATGNPLAKCAALIATGKKISELRDGKLLPASGDGKANGVSVKEAVLPWNRFRRIDGKGVDAVLGPEMKSTGEVMGIANTFGEAYSKSQSAAFGALPKSGRVFISLSDNDKEAAITTVQQLSALGFQVVTTAGTHQYFANHGITSVIVRKHSEGRGPNGEPTAVDLINSGEVNLVINTPLGRGSRQDGWLIRTAAIQRSVPIITTISGFKAAVSGMSALQNKSFDISSIQEWQAVNI